MTPGMPKPAYDPEMAAFLDVYPAPKDITRDYIPIRRQDPFIQPTAEDALADQTYKHEERQVDSQHGPITISIFRPIDEPSDTTARPGFFFTHGGGLFCGNRFQGIREYLRLTNPVGATLISVEYRLTPEHPYPAAIDDCWAALRYVSDHAVDIGISPDGLVVGGPSAGGHLAAALALRARDEGAPKIIAQLLDCPMLDDRNNTTSAQQYVGEGTWSRNTNALAWEMHLGNGEVNTSPYAAPARFTDLSGLPPAFISVGSAELFRDECVSYASALWKAGVQCELHVWPGGFHIFDAMMPMHEMSIASVKAKGDWVKRIDAQQLS